MSAPRVVKVCAEASLGRRVDTAALAARFPQHVTLVRRVAYVAVTQHRFLGGRARTTRVILRMNGQMVVTFVRSIVEAKRLLAAAAAQVNLPAPRQFQVRMLVAKWHVSKRAAPLNLVVGHARVHVRPSGLVSCAGVKSRADLKKVHGLVV